MRIVIFLSCLLCAVSIAQAGQRLYCSPNEQYLLSIDFSVSAKETSLVQLSNASGKILWKKNMDMYWTMQPIVSNTGVTVFPYFKNVLAYHADGSRFLEFPFNPTEDVSVAYGWMVDGVGNYTVHHYCDDDGSYLLLYKQSSDNTSKLVCINRDKTIRWTYDFGRAFTGEGGSPSWIKEPSFMLITPTSVTINDFGHGGVDHVNRCYIINRGNGKFIAVLPGKAHAFPFVSGDTLFMTVKETWSRSQVSAYDATTGKVLCYVLQHDVVDWLYTGYSHRLIFALQYVQQLPRYEELMKRIDAIHREKKDCWNGVNERVRSLASTFLDQERVRKENPEVIPEQWRKPPLPGRP